MTRAVHSMLNSVQLNRFAWLFLLIIAGIAQAQTAQPAAAPAAQPSLQQRVANLKEWLKASEIQLKNYEWIETTTVTHEGKTVSVTEKSCYYDVTGKVQKVPVGAPKDASHGLPGILPPGRLLKHLEEHKKKDLEEYMQKAAALVHSYIPPDPNGIQRVVNNGGMSMQMLDPGRKIQLSFANYKLPGDSLSIQMALPTNQLLSVDVSSYVDDPQDKVTLTATTSVLPDGTIYLEKSVLSAPNKDVEVTVENTGYHKVN